MKLRYKIIVHLIVYILGIFTAVAQPIIKWSILAPLFGKRVSMKKSIEGLALRDGVVLKDFFRVPAEESMSLTRITKYKPPIIISQEYPCSQGFNYRQSINLLMHTAVMTYQNDWQAFWLGMGNISEKVKNFRNPSLFLNFHGEIQVKLDQTASQGWLETDPNFTYFLKMAGSIQPGQGLRLNPLFVKFPKEGIYTVAYSITVDDELPISGEFNIKVVK